MKHLGICAVLLALSTMASADVVQLDISSGFNTDNWLGVTEYKSIVDNGGGVTDLNQAQGGTQADGLGQGSFTAFNYNLIGAIDATTASTLGVSGYGTALKDNTQATPLDGVLTSTEDARVYHIASHAGNATLSGDWLDPADTSFTGTGSSVTVNMARKMNAMTTYINHAGSIVLQPTATLNIGQQAKYSDINFVFAGWDQADGLRNAQIVAVYSDDSEDIIYSFSTANQNNGPCLDDSDPGIYDPAEFTAIHAVSQGYNVAAGSTGGISDHGGTLWEFATPLTVDETKTLKAIRLEDQSPTTIYNARGLSIYAATATLVPEPATIMLMAAGLPVLLKHRRRRG